MIQWLASLPVKDVSWLPLLTMVIRFAIVYWLMWLCERFKIFSLCGIFLSCFSLTKSGHCSLFLTDAMWPSYAVHNLLRPGYLKRESITSCLYNHYRHGVTT
jgi:hypothetical protein